MFREQELFGKIALDTFDISPEVLDSIVAGEMGFGMDAQQYLMGYLPVIDLVAGRRPTASADQLDLHRPALRRHAGEGQGDPDAGQAGHPLSPAAPPPRDRTPRPAAQTRRGPLALASARQGRTDDEDRHRRADARATSPGKRRRRTADERLAETGWLTGLLRRPEAGAASGLIATIVIFALLPGAERALLAAKAR